MTFRCSSLPRLPWAVLLVLLSLALLSPERAWSRTPWPGERWETTSPPEAGMDEKLLFAAREYALSGGGSGYITRGGKLVLSWGDPRKRYDLKSSSKSIGFTAVGLALLDGKVKLSDRAAKHHPRFGVPPESNRAQGWAGKITLFHLATQTAGFDKDGGYTKLLFPPGTKWSYSDGGPNWLAECITLAYGEDLQSLLYRRVFAPLGIQPADLRWRKNAYREETIATVQRREFGSGVHANVDAMARIGLLYLRGGKWRDRQLLPADFPTAVSRVPRETGGLPVYLPDRYPNASSHYGLLWWNNADGTLAGVPRDAFWSWGLYDSLIVVIPSLDIVVSRAGGSWTDQRGSAYGKLEPFLGPIAASVSGPPAHGRAPYPPSPVIGAIHWAPKASIVRQADGGDNWPLTWAGDGEQYTAYGDGWGFEPKVETKLSLGLAKVTGGPDDFRGFNIRSDTGERVGQGPAGEKASGMLMVAGTLYMWVRNAANSKLAWSADHGRNWTWSGWKFTESFGAPTFLNFGKNYSGARDDYVYVYSHDDDSAYRPADGMVLARVPKSALANQNAYEFFAGLLPGGEPLWKPAVRDRALVFRHPGRAYRSGISYNAGLGRYLWCQIIPGDDTRFEGGFGVYDAPEPWGPWTTVYISEKWDTGPGETCSFPAKWMSRDGKTVHMVFSGEDAFSVRKATLMVGQSR